MDVPHFRLKWSMSSKVTFMIQPLGSLTAHTYQYVVRKGQNTYVEEKKEKNKEGFLHAGQNKRLAAMM